MEFLNPLSSFPAYSASYTATAGSTATWPIGPAGVVVWCTTAAYVRVGEGVTATTSDTPIPANTPIPFVVPGNLTSSWRVSAVRVDSDGTLYAKPINQP